MLKSIAKLIAIMDAQTRVQLALLFIPMLLMTVLEVVSIGLILPVIQVVLLGQTDGELARILIALLPDADQDILGFWVAGIFAVFFIFKNIILLITIYVISLKINHIIADYTKRVFQIYVSKSMIFHFKNNSALLLRNITGGVGVTLESGRLALLMLLDAMLMFGAAFLLIFVEPYATLGATLTLGIIGILFFKIFSPIFRYWGEQSMNLEGEMIKWVNQSLTGIRDVKLMHANGYLASKISDIAHARAKFSSRSVTSIQIPRLLIETAVVVGFLGVISLLLSMDRSSGSVVSILGLFGMAALRIMPSLNRLLISASEIRRRDSYITTIHDAVISHDDEDADLFAGENIEPLPFVSEIVIDDLTYSYPDAEHHALTNFSLSVKKGQTIGFVGPSGAGKSTLMDIILGLLKPSSGLLLIDGSDAYGNIAGWQEHIGFVPQQIFVMDDTIRRNVAFAVNDEEIDDRRVSDVLEMTQFDAFVNGLPDGLDTMLGEHGTRLSGGQRQRIAIARALYRDPDVLVFDEATSALDNVTERDITQTIESLTGDKTIFIVAHRLGTVRNCDKIVFMKDGKFEAHGTYDELIEGNSEFRYLAQVGGHSESEAVSQPE